MNIRKELTASLVLKGETVKYADCTRIIEDQECVICNLQNELEVLLEDNAYFFYKGTNKNVPFTLTKDEIAKIKETTNEI